MVWYELPLNIIDNYPQLSTLLPIKLQISESVKRILKKSSIFKNDFEIVLFDIINTSTVEGIVQEITDSNLDSVVIDFRLDETGVVNFNGDAVAEKLLANRPHFPILMLTSFERDAIDHVEDVNIINAKDILDGDNPEKVNVLGAKIYSNIQNYYSKIEKTEKRIVELVKKKNEGLIEPKEEEELTKCYLFIDEIYPDEKEIPANLIQKEAITKLNDFVVQSKEILDQLKKEKR